jgi:hypothetical protein
LKRTSTVQAIVQAARPKTIATPLQLGLAVDVDCACGSKFLVMHLARLGFCVSYDELVKYKQSVIMAEQANVPRELCSKATFTQ